MDTLRSLAWAPINLVQALAVGFWTMVSGTLALLSLLIDTRGATSLRVAREIWSPGLLRIGGVRLTVEGGEQVDFSRPHIFLMNHQSMTDIPAAFVALPVGLRFVAKSSLAHVPFLGWYMRAIGMPFVDRGDSAKAIESLQRAGEMVRAGASLLAYPEGTRTIDGTILPFKKGPFRLAIEAGVPIVPIAIEGSQRVLPRDGFKVRPGPVRVRIGAPIPTAGSEPAGIEALIRQVREAIIELHLQIGGQGGDRSAAVAARGVEGIGRALDVPPRRSPDADSLQRSST